MPEHVSNFIMLDDFFTWNMPGTTWNRLNDFMVLVFLTPGTSVKTLG